MKRNGEIGESVLALRWELEAATEEVGGGVPELGRSLGEDSAMELVAGEERRRRGHCPGWEWQHRPGEELSQTCRTTRR